MTTTLLLASSNGKLLWYVTRGSGVVALLLLTASVVLGVVTTLRWRGERWPRFAITDAHRNLTLLSIVFVAIHVVTTVADSFAPIGLADGIFPFLSPYRPIWLGLGTVSFDLLLALVVTSLMRGRIPYDIWRAVHWLAYAAWPVALLHSLGTGSDARTGWLEALGVACLLAVVASVIARLALGGGLRPARLGGLAAAVATTIGLLVWYANGPLDRGWAKRAGTPTSILARKGTAVQTIRTSATVAQPPTSFSSTVNGTVTNSANQDGTQRVDISLRLSGGPRGAVRIALQGIPVDGGVQMTSSGVSFVPATTQSVYTGTIVSLAGTNIGASVTDSAGDNLQLRFILSIDNVSGSVTGRVTTV